MIRALAALGALVLGVLTLPSADAVDLLPAEARLGDDEARLVVRSAGGVVRVSADPAVLAAAVAPGANADTLSPTPIEVNGTHVWRGIEGIVEIVLLRADATQPVDIIVEDGANVGVWVEWPPAPRGIPAPFAGAAILLATVLRRSIAR